MSLKGHVSRLEELVEELIARGAGSSGTPSSNQAAGLCCRLRRLLGTFR